MQSLPFVIIGAYRDDEVDERHDLSKALEYMKKNSVKLYTIEVLPFTLLEMKELLWTIMQGKDDLVPNISHLAKILFEKSQGNIFFYFEVCLSVALTLAFAISLRREFGLF
jgi:predicted ATPase